MVVVEEIRWTVSVSLRQMLSKKLVGVSVDTMRLGGQVDVGVVLIGVSYLS